MGWVDPWVGLGWVEIFQIPVGWVVLGPRVGGLGWVRENEQNFFREYHFLRKCHKMEYNSSSFILFQIQIHEDLTI